TRTLRGSRIFICSSASTGLLRTIPALGRGVFSATAKVVNYRKWGEGMRKCAIHSRVRTHDDHEDHLTRPRRSRSRRRVDMRGHNRRVVTLSLLLACGISTAGVATYQGAGAQGRAGGAGAQVIQVEKLKDNLFLLRGGGGNTAVFVGADGVTVVDTKIPGWGQPLIAKIKELTAKPVIRIINSHTHYDHVGGNVDFPTTIDIVGHENTLANMKKGLPPKGAEARVPPDVFKANNGKNMAKRTFKDKLTIGSGADRIDLYYFGRGHTNGDAWTVFPALRVM